MHLETDTLARVTYVEILTCSTRGDGSEAVSETIVKVEFETDQGPGAVLISGERSRSLDVLNAQRERRLIPVPTP